jgi:excisionase family DNA binding protein
MTNVSIEPRSVFTTHEVALALRVSPETIRRKIQAGELNALELGGNERKQYRIFLSDLVAWLGDERVRRLFGIGQAATTIREAFATVSDSQFEEALAAAAKARPKTKKPETARPTPSRQEIAKRFRK